MDKARNRGKLSEMVTEWSPGAVEEAPSFQPSFGVHCARSRDQEKPPEASFGRNWPLAASPGLGTARNEHRMTVGSSGLPRQPLATIL